MNCSNCHKKVRDDASICPHCDAILDESILGALPSDDGPGDQTPPPAPPPKRTPAGPVAPPARARARAPVEEPVAPPARGRLRAPIDAPEVEAPEPEEQTTPGASADAGQGYTNKWSQYWTEDQSPPKKTADQSRGPSAAPASPPPSGEVSASDPFAELSALWTRFLALHFEDKLTVCSSAGLSLMSLMSWRSYHLETAEDDFGFLTWGLLTLLLSMGSLLAVWARHNGKLEHLLPRFRLPQVAAALGALAAATAFLFVVGNFDVGTKGESISKPAFGAYFSALFGAGILVGGILTHRRERG